MHVAHVEPTLDCPEEKSTRRMEEGVFNNRCDWDGEQEKEESELCVHFEGPGFLGSDASVHYVNMVGEPIDGMVDHLRRERV